MNDVRPERERYRRAGLLDQLREGILGLRRHPGIVLLLAAIVGGLLFLRLTTPTAVPFESFNTGDCMYVRAGTGDNLGGARAIGTPADVAAALYRDGAERAACDMSHSHEVADVFAFSETRGEAYPGLTALQERQQAACETAFAALVGGPLEGSGLELTVIVPAQSDWDAGRRVGACLVNRADGSFLSSRASNATP
jgi:hypothetical protein